MGDMETLNYFTCTLGEAADINSRSPTEFQTVNKLIEFRARKCPNSPAAVFPVPVSSLDNWGYEIFTFEDLYHGSIEVANKLFPLNQFTEQQEHPKCVALLCHSSVDFLFAWLGLMKAGISVLLIASVIRFTVQVTKSYNEKQLTAISPQCSPKAISALCKSCEASELYHDKAHSSLASAAATKPESNLRPSSLYWQRENSGNTIIQIIKRLDLSTFSQDWPEQTSQDVAYIHHSSGTSTGTPKSIPQTNHGAVGVLPCLKGQNAAIFTTTPLYHGGIADCLRAWTSGAMICLFPGAGAPITPNTILASLSACKNSTQQLEVPKIRYFSSVPYVLQMLAESPAGLAMLQEMEIVGVGGAALPQKIGDDLVQNGVRLISRFGSAECGFLLSSHRSYKSDKAWQYLRKPETSCHLQFEEQGDGSGLSELIVPSTWPHIAKRNRDNGNYATNDLFEPHPNIKNAWRYHSRSDSQITLLTGKKFDPTPFEDAMTSYSPIIRDVLIFGNDRQLPGALIFTAHDVGLLEKEERDKVWQTIEEVNSTAPSHSRISRDMFMVMTGLHPPLKRSSKGTLLRGQVEKEYVSEIESLYRVNFSKLQSENSKNSASSAGRMESIIRGTVVEVIGTDSAITNDTDFYHFGVDSTKAIRIRSLLQQRLVRETLPWNIVYDCGNIQSLIRYISENGNGEIKLRKVDGSLEMVNLVEEYSDFEFPQIETSKKRCEDSEKRSVLLTGVTGGLGAHILDQLRNDPSVSQIICLVRATDSRAAGERVSCSLIQRRKAPLPSHGPEERVWCLPVRFHEPSLGLMSEVRGRIQERTSHIIHAAWAVNFSLPLRSFVKEHISGLQKLINLAYSCVNFEQIVFCSSTASVFNQARGAGMASIPERIFSNPPPDDALGYSKSKWVAEGICSEASKHPQMSRRIKVLRIGQLTGDTENGVWNRSEAWPLMLSTARPLGCLPKLDEALSWLPVDVAARAVIDILLLPFQKGAADSCPVYHLVNNSRETMWSHLLHWTREASGVEFRVVDPGIWIEKLENVDSHAAKSILWLWRARYGKPHDEMKRDEETGKEEHIDFDAKNARAASVSVRNVGPVDEVLIRKICKWLGEIQI